jgi:hypothetical protein
MVSDYDLEEPGLTLLLPLYTNPLPDNASKWPVIYAIIRILLNI